MIRFASTVLQVSHEGAADGFFHREHLLVDRLADDDGEGARLDRLVDVLQLRHAAGRDHGTGGDAAGQARRRLQIRARAHAVAADVGVKDGRRAGARHRLADLQRGDLRGLLPALDGPHALARVDGDHDAAGELRERRGDLPRPLGVDGGAGAVARALADGLAAQKIDCGEYQHGARLIPPSYAVMKAASRAAPASWLFSGWNWPAKPLSRATAEQNVSPWSVSSATSSGRAGTAK